jgi:hypothetical protein
MVFINAWNEWAEGAHLEPDARFGRANLEAVRDLLGPRPPRTEAVARSTDGRFASPAEPAGSSEPPAAEVLTAKHVTQ